MIPSTSAGDLRELLRVPLRIQASCERGRPSPESLGLVEWESAASRVEAVNSGFLSISDFDHRAPAELGQESQALSCVEEWKSTCLSIFSQDDRPLVEFYLGPVGFSSQCN